MPHPALLAGHGCVGGEGMTAWREGPGAGGEGGEQGHGYKGVTTKLLIMNLPLCRSESTESISNANLVETVAVTVCVPL